MERSISLLYLVLWSQCFHFCSKEVLGKTGISFRENQAMEEKEEIFLKEFPAQRKKIENCIQYLLEMAKAIDETHKKCTKTSVVANSASAASGVFTLLGMILAPVTAGGSLILTTGGLGLGIVGTVTGTSASIYERVSTSEKMKKAQELINECGETLQLPADAEPLKKNDTNPVSETVSSIWKISSSVKEIHTNVQSLKAVRASTGLSTAAIESTSQVGKQVEKGSEGTRFAVTKEARLMDAAAIGVSLVRDAYNIVQNVQHLKEGAKTEMAAEIRKKANELEVKLQELSKRYKILKDKLRKMIRSTVLLVLVYCILTLLTACSTYAASA